MITAACRDPDGMTRSSELVMRLNGSEASDGTEFDLVFGRSEGELSLLRRPPCRGSASASAR